MIQPLQSLSPERFCTPAILKKLAAASRSLAELKGLAASILNQGILITALGLQEAKDSSAIENIVTTHDEIFKEAAFPEIRSSPAAKEVSRYREALQAGFELVREQESITIRHILTIQELLERNSAGFRKG